MSTKNQDQFEKDGILQTKTIEFLMKERENNEFITVSHSGNLGDDLQNSNIEIFSILAPKNKISKMLEKSDWDFTIGSSIPRIDPIDQSEGDNNKFEIEYSRYCGNSEESGIIPLVVRRNFDGAKKGYCELSEEFRHFYNLYESGDGKFYRITDHESKTLVATISGSTVKVRQSELRKFLAVKEMYLSIQFYGTVHSGRTLEQLQLKPGNCLRKKDERCNYFLHIGNDKYSTLALPSFSLLCGKVLISPIKKSRQCIPWISEDEDKFETFITRVEKNCIEIRQSCDPGGMSNHEFLTKIFFNDKVLEKYRTKSNYKIRHGHIDGLGLSINEYPGEDFISVYLGDLGRNLSYKEQKYWASENIAPFSLAKDPNDQRNLYSKFNDSDKLEHVFKRELEKLHNTCTDILGWQIINPLVEKDKYRLGYIRELTSNEQSDIDALILSLDIILIDSLNIDHFRKTQSNLSSHSIIENFKVIISESKNSESNAKKDIYKDISSKQIEFLFDLRRLRNKGAAHAKDHRYEKTYSNTKYIGKNYEEQSKEMIQDSIGFLKFLMHLVHKNFFSSKNRNS